MHASGVSGKAVAITGSGPGRGIGRALAAGFAAAGADLVINHLEEDTHGLDTFLAELRGHGGNVVTVPGDIAREEVAERLVATTVRSYGRIDVLVNNAAISTQSRVHEMPTEMWDRMLAVNLTAVFLTTRAAVRRMIAQRYGRVINIASQLALKGGVDHAHYAAAKAGVIGFTKSVAREGGAYGITANCIAPGPIDTQMMRNVPSEWTENKRAELVIPRFGDPEQVVPTALLLASEPGGDLYTGQTLGPNCGDVMP
ncbi:SDR family oxidoreductase [Actinoallomurus sp. NBC_01490]|uniref:SDR family NAD(P)-dependent oxidoreductase n=1 Tax=Actinoallomurus sp. NBC_01490 TaxID=2903557 RepID=UPI002E37BA5F|nr:SDR family oxidoreductase [Actinoallomurus sp. NBC_01490]